MGPRGGGWQQAWSGAPPGGKCRCERCGGERGIEVEDRVRGPGGDTPGRAQLLFSETRPDVVLAAQRPQLRGAPWTADVHRN